MALHEELNEQGNFLFRNRSYLPLALLPAALALKFYQERYGDGASETAVAETLELLAPFVGLTGLAVRVFVVGYSSKSTSGRNTKKGQVAESLNTTGAYSISRNPLYVGNYLMSAAVAMVTGSLWFVLLFTLAFWLYYERIVYAEEAFLRRKYGDAYLAWAANTSVFVPTRVHYVAPAERFSWKKVIKREKNGLFALLLTLCVFKIVGDYAEGNVSLPDESASIAAAASSGVFYLFVRLLKKRTSILEEAGR